MGYRDNKRSPRQKMQDFMSTPKGQTIMNYAYNWGASIVIMGTLFKLTHLPGANIMLFAGMGTEVLIFFISAFDLSGVNRDAETGTQASLGAAPAVVGSVFTNEGQVGAMPTGGGISGSNAGAPSIVVVQGGSMSPGGLPIGNQSHIQSGQPIQVQPALSQSIGAPVTPEMEEATTAYLEQLKAMTDMLSRCTAQTQFISQDTEQMNLLGKNLAGINAIYEMQLRSVSTQIGTIDQVHEQTRRMARQIEELNEVYARMLQAMTSK